MRAIGTDNENHRHVERYELYLDADHVLEVEAIERDDWESMRDSCLECTGTEFDHVRYEGGHYGQYENAVIERTDYWYQHGSLYTACKTCDEILHKNPAYDIIEAIETGRFNP